MSNPARYQYFPKRCRLVHLRAVSQAYHRSRPAAGTLTGPLPCARPLPYAGPLSCARSLAARSENLIATAATEIHPILDSPTVATEFLAHVIVVVRTPCRCSGRCCQLLPPREDQPLAASNVDIAVAQLHPPPNNFRPRPSFREPIRRQTQVRPQ